MPIHNLGYREWTGQKESGRSRWKVIAGIGIRRAWQSTWLRRMVFIVWAAPLAYAIFLFAFEQASQTSGMDARVLRNVAQTLLPAESQPALREAIDNFDPSDKEKMISVVRPLVWKSTMLQLARTQTIGLILVVGLVAPSLISHDVRSRAFLLYFSRPLSRLQYIFGKFSTVAGFLLITCTIPQLMLFLFALLLSPDISVLQFTWDIPLRALLASAAIIIPTSLLALMLSSLTVESRFATFGWFCIWIFGLMAYTVSAGVNNGPPEGVLRAVFLCQMCADLSAWIMDVPLTHPQDLGLQIATTIGITLISMAVIFRKVSEPMRA